MSKLTKEYEELLSSMRDDLEAAYSYNQSVVNDHARAYETLGELMRFKLIDRDDPRLTLMTSRHLKSMGFEARHRFKKDYRKSSDFYPDWVFGYSPYAVSMSVETLEHWGKRVEGVYEGDTRFESHTVKAVIREIVSSNGIKGACRNIEGIIRAQTGGKADTSEIQELALMGVHRLYEIEVTSTCPKQFRYLGYLELSYGSNGKQAVLIINGESMLGMWLPINETIDAITKVFNNALDEVINFRNLTSVSKLLDRQRAMLRESDIIKERARRAEQDTIREQENKKAMERAKKRKREENKANKTANRKAAETEDAGTDGAGAEEE